MNILSLIYIVLGTPPTFFLHAQMYTPPYNIICVYHPENWLCTAAALVMNNELHITPLAAL
jgi:hypothetical protein